MNRCLYLNQPSILPIHCFESHKPFGWGSLNTPNERCSSDAGSVGFIFLALPILVPWGLFLIFFWLNLGFTAPNYPGRPLMRSSKAPPNQKNRGQILPTPSEPSLRAWQVQRLLGVFMYFPSSHLAPRTLKVKFMSSFHTILNSRTYSFHPCEHSSSAKQW